MRIRKPCISAVLLTLLALTAGCPQEPQTPPAMDLGTDAFGPDVPVIEELPREKKDAASRDSENPFIEEKPEESPASPLPNASRPAAEPDTSEEAAAAKTESGEIQGPQLRLPDLPARAPHSPAAEPKEG